MNGLTFLKLLVYLNPPFVLLGGGASAIHEQAYTPYTLPLSEEVQAVAYSSASLRVAEERFLHASVRDAFYPLRDWRVVEPQLAARSAMVADINLEKILYTKDVYTPYPMASLTKLMTSLVALERFTPGIPVTLSTRAIAAEGDRVGFVEGEKMMVGDLVKAMMVSSSNDAAVALAEHAGEAEFIQAMNHKAAALGLSRTRFENPTGLDSGNHFSSAWDLAVLARAAFSNGAWWQISSKHRVVIHSADNTRVHVLSNTNRVLDRYSNILASKTGYTDNAKEALVMVFTAPSKEPYVMVILGSDDRVKDAHTLFAWLEKAFIWK